MLLGRNDEMTAGDFVRNIKQLTDLLGQLAANATDPATASAPATPAMPSIAASWPSRVRCRHRERRERGRLGRAGPTAR